jgi:GST-like protein
MITLYTAATGNGQRVSIMLEECDLAYQVVAIDFSRRADFAETLKIANPMGQIPAISDSDGPDGGEYCLGESSAILRYLARKTGKLLPPPGLAEAEADRWTAITSGGLQAAPTTMFFAQQLGMTADAPIIAKQREVVWRYLVMMDARLGGSAFLAGDAYSYVDILGFTLAHGTLPRFGFDMTEFPAVARWAAQVAARPAVQRGLAVPG